MDFLQQLSPSNRPVTDPGLEMQRLGPGLENHPISEWRELIDV